MPDDTTEKANNEMQAEKTYFVISSLREAGSEIRRRINQVLSYIITSYATKIGNKSIYSFNYHVVKLWEII